MNKALTIAKILFFVSAAAVLGIVTYQVATLPELIGKAVAERVDKAGVQLAARDKQIGETLESIKKTTKDVSQFVNDTYYDNYANVETTTVILRDVAEITHTINTQTLPQVGQTIAMLGEIKKDADRLADAVDDDLVTLNKAIANAAALLGDLDQAVKDRSPDVERIAESAAKAVDDLDKVISDPNVAKTMAHVESISDSTDQIFKRLATKAGALKTMLHVLLQAVHFTLYRPF